MVEDRLRMACLCSFVAISTEMSSCSSPTYNVHVHIHVDYMLKWAMWEDFTQVSAVFFRAMAKIII